MKITVYSISPYKKSYLEKGNNDEFEINYLKEKLTIKTVSLAKGSKAILIFANDNASADW